MHYYECHRLDIQISNGSNYRLKFIKLRIYSITIYINFDLNCLANVLRNEFKNIDSVPIYTINS